MSTSTTAETPDLPTTQRAWLVVRQGNPAEALKLEEKAPVPKLEKGDVLVKVQAAALNPVGYKMMQLLPNWAAKRPHVAEHEFAGVVADPNGTDLQEGQEVYGYVFGSVQSRTRQGGLAEYVRVPRGVVAPRPANVSAIEASGLLLTGLTAYKILFGVAQLEAGQRVFINGGSTAVGINAIQLAKAAGCYVGAAASSKREPFLKSIGVDYFVDYTKGPVWQQLEQNPPEPRYNVFLEAVGTADVLLYTHSEAYIAPNGVFISVGPQPDRKYVSPTIWWIWLLALQMFWYIWETMLRPRFLGGTRRAWKVFMQESTQDDIKAFAQYVADGRVKPVVDSIYCFDDVPKAYSRMMTKHACGKVVVKVDPEAY